MIRGYNERVLNPLMLRLAGRRYWYAAVIRHTGRRSGRPYATPVVANAIKGGFLIPLPYGTEVDWLQNVLASGRATVDANGHSYPVTDPVVIDADQASALLSPLRRIRWRLFRMGRFLKLTIMVEAQQRP